MRAIISGYYGYGNGGDEALLATLLQMLPQQVTPIVLSGHPGTTAQLHQVEAKDRNHLPTLLQALRESDVWIWGGGSLIQDVTSALSPLYYTALMALAQRRGLKTVAWAQGIGPLQRPTTRWLARQTFQRCTAVTVRDRNSAQLAAAWGLSATLAPDPVWALAAQPPTEHLDLPPPRIAVSLRAHPQLTPERLACLGQALKQLQDNYQASILFIPFQPAQDLTIAQSLQTALTGPHKICIETDPRRLKGLFQSVDLAICMRLHALIMAAAEGCRCYALSYDPKVQQVMDDIQCAGGTLAALSTEAHSLYQAWQTLLETGSGLTTDAIATRRQQAAHHQAILQQLLEPPLKV